MARARTALATVSLAGALVFCSTGPRAAPDAQAAAAWSDLKRLPGVAALAREVGGGTVEESGALVVAPSRRGGVTARLGLHASDPFELDVPGVAPLRVLRAGASASRGVAIGGAVVYADAWDGGDLVIFARAGVIEELVTERLASAGIDYELQLPVGWSLVQIAPALVEIRDGAGRGTARMRADRAWDAEGTTLGTRTWVEGQHVHVEVASEGRLPVVVDPSWETLGSGLVTARASHTATPLGDGTTLFVGGYAGSSSSGALATPLASAEVFDLGQDTFPWQASFKPATGMLAAARAEHTATALLDGRVLVAGGIGAAGTTLDSLELYDPTTQQFSAVASALSVARAGHTATRLADGTVLLVGGSPSSTGAGSNTADLFDPATGHVAPVTSKLQVGRAHHTASLLPDGRIVIAGGAANGAIETFDPASRTFSSTGATLACPRSDHTAIVIASAGLVYFTGGAPAGACTSNDEWLDTTLSTESSQSFSVSGAAVRSAAVVATDRALMIGGEQPATAPGPEGSTVTYSRATVAVGVLSFPQLATTGNGASSAPALSIARGRHTATPLRDGTVLVAGGAEMQPSSPAIVLSDVERYRPEDDSDTLAGRMSQARYLHTSSLMGDGRVLVAGGCSTSGQPLSTAELFDASTGTFGTVATLVDARADHVATTLPDGRVLLVGGGKTSGAEIFDPTTSASAAVSGMPVGYTELTATLLVDGQVLVAGGACASCAGSGGEGTTANAYLIDPTKLAATKTKGLMQFPRHSHAAARLADGRVLIAGGYSQGLGAFPIEVYDPAKDTFASVGTLHAARANPTAVLVAPGSVLVAGGANPTQSFVPQSSTELVVVDAAATSASVTVGPPMQVARHRHTATTMVDGRVVYVGGDCPVAPANQYGCGGIPNGCGAGFHSHLDVLDPLLVSFAPTPIAMVGTGEDQAAALLTTGDLLSTGGNDVYPLDSSELVSIRSSPRDGSSPALQSFSGTAVAGVPVVLLGSSLAGVVDRSGGTPSGSHWGVPQAVWVPLAGGTAVSSPIADWNGSSVAWFAPVSPLLGPGVAFVSVDGVVGTGTFVAVAAAPTGIACTLDTECATGHCVDGVCCNTTCTGACMACSVTAKGGGAAGECAPVRDGATDSQCVESTCGETGQCAAGQCATYPTGFSCGPSGATCQNKACVTPPAKFVCDGNAEVAPPSPPTQCAPYVCDQATGHCKSGPCGSNGDCSGGNSCVSGACVAFEAASPPGANGCGVAPGGGGGAVWWLWAITGVSLMRRRHSRNG